MEESPNSNLDIFKNIIKGKLQDKPETSMRDQQLWERVAAEINVTQKSPQRVSYVYWYAAAAILLISITIGYTFLHTNKAMNSTVVASEVIETSDTNHTKDDAPKSSNGEKKDTKSTESTIASKDQNLAKKTLIVSATYDVVNHTLPDGSNITLNKKSSISTLVSFKDKREVTLSGEAYFEVKHENNRPFLVHFGIYTLEVLGTKFNVRNISTEEFTEITVTEGKVRVFENKSKVNKTLKAGEQLKLHLKNEPVITQVEAENFISWKTNILNFKKSRLEDVVVLLGRAHLQEITIDQHLKACTFSGDLSDLSLNDALKVIEASTGLKVERSKQKIHITGLECD